VAEGRGGRGDCRARRQPASCGPNFRAAISAVPCVRARDPASRALTTRRCSDCTTRSSTWARPADRTTEPSVSRSTDPRIPTHERSTQDFRPAPDGGRVYDRCASPAHLGAVMRAARIFGTGHWDEGKIRRFVRAGMTGLRRSSSGSASAFPRTESANSSAGSGGLASASPAPWQIGPQDPRALGRGGRGEGEGQQSAAPTMRA